MKESRCTHCGATRDGARETLVPVLVRLAPEQREELQRLARETRIPQAVLLREAVADVIAKHATARRTA
jgi:hypothetical protein